ncbi:enolase C-terminal domain-like protein [Streptomyces sp. NPDC088725]|uniref:enolase C-terminal domain-like protein n=1 Tax=Streptomyces sp. NPDC088725 TaxID=3365873 RepID=UPI003821CD94
MTSAPDAVLRDAVPPDAPAVDRLDVSVYTVPTDAPEADGTLEWDTTTMVLVEAVSGTVTGLGWTYGSPAAASVVTGRLAALVTGQSAYDVAGANEEMSRAVRDVGRQGLVAGAISAVDIALWDLKARLLGLPLVHLLGAARPDVPVYGSGGFTTYSPRELEQQLRDWTQEQDIPRVKIKIGEGRGRAPDQDLDRIRRARAVIGDERELYVDADGGYSRKQAVMIAEHFADSGVSWFEEPVPCDDLTGLRQIRESVPVEITAGEYAYDLPGFARLIDAGAVDCLQADATRCGGITAWLGAAAVARSHNLEISGHHAPHVHAHVAAAVPNLRHVEWFHDHIRIENAFFDGALDPAGGVVAPGTSGAPGLGLEIRREAMERYRTA